MTYPNIWGPQRPIAWLQFSQLSVESPRESVLLGLTSAASKMGVSEGDSRSHTHCESRNRLRTWQRPALFSSPYPASLRSSEDKADVLRAGPREDKFGRTEAPLNAGR